MNKSERDQIWQNLMIILDHTQKKVKQKNTYKSVNAFDEGR